MNEECLLLSATFVLDGLVDIEHIFDAQNRFESAALQAELAAALAALSYDTQPVNGGDAIHQPGQAAVDIGASQTARVDEVLTVALYSGKLPAVLREARLVIGNLGTAALLLSPARPGLTSSEIETAVGPWLEVQIAAVSSTAAFPLKDAGRLDERPADLVPAGILLWWDRILRVGGGEVAQVGTVSVRLEGAVCEVGYAKTFIRDERAEVTADVLGDVARGIFMAAEDWLIADGLNRTLTSFLLDARRASLVGGRRDLTRFVARGQSLSIQGQLLRLYLDERDRYLALERRAIWHAAREVWGLTGQVAGLEDRVASVNQQISQLAQARQSLVDASRNGALYVIALLTVVQSFMVIADFNFADDTVATSTFREAVALVLAVAAIGTILYALVIAPARARTRARRLVDETDS